MEARRGHHGRRPEKVQGILQRGTHREEKKTGPVMDEESSKKSSLGFKRNNSVWVRDGTATRDLGWRGKEEKMINI